MNTELIISLKKRRKNTYTREREREREPLKLSLNASARVAFLLLTSVVALVRFVNDPVHYFIFSYIEMHSDPFTCRKLSSSESSIVR